MCATRTFFQTYDSWKLDSGYEDGDGPQDAPWPKIKVVSHYDPKPIPDRRFDWSAVTDNYDGQIDDPVGYGATEAEAIADLQDQLNDD